ncbi:MAG: hypothetical protein WBC22_16575 [Sedimentisphaerales bacterium]
MRKLLLVFLVIVLGGCVGTRPANTRATILRLNTEFVPIVADSVLNNRYYYKTICALGETRLYFLQDRQDSGPDMVCVYEGDLKSNPAVIDNTDIFYRKTGLQLFTFYPSGLQREFAGYECSARQAGITVVKQDRRLALFLDQLFSRGGSGGHRELIARKYMIVENGKAEVTDGYSIVTNLRIGYPRSYGSGEWSKGSMSYYHCFDQEVSLEDNKLVVGFRKQEFELKPLFAAPDEVIPKPEHGFWGERFRYNDFLLPREVEVHEICQREELQLKALFIR